MSENKFERETKNTNEEESTGEWFPNSMNGIWRDAGQKITATHNNDYGGRWESNYNTIENKWNDGARIRSLRTAGGGRKKGRAARIQDMSRGILGRIAVKEERVGAYVNRINKGGYTRRRSSSRKKNRSRRRRKTRRKRKSRRRKSRRKRKTRRKRFIN